MLKTTIRKTVCAIIVCIGFVYWAAVANNSALAREDCEKDRVGITVQSTELINNGSSVRVIIDLDKKELERIKAEDEERIKAEREKLKKLSRVEKLQETFSDPFVIVLCVLIGIILVITGVLYLKELKEDGEWPFNKNRR